jgi:serine/threonine protein kinase
MKTGDRIDRYEVLEPLGQGGMAAVFKVRHTTLGTLHALKVLTVPHRAVQDRMVQEGVLQARLGHPNIVAVTDVLDIDGAPGLLMEYVPGGTLEDLIEGGGLPLAEAERLFRGVLAAVEHAHQHGVVHRDLKPANVLLSPAPGGPIPKVADFGVAKVLDSALATDRKATRAGVAMGSPSYMSPEQIRDAGGVDERSDVFALGCILYELVTGRMAFQGPDVFSIFERITSGTFPPVESLAADVPERIRAAIAGALQVDANRRLPSCARLRAVLDGEVSLRRPLAETTISLEAPSSPARSPDTMLGVLAGAGLLALLSIAATALVVILPRLATQPEVARFEPLPAPTAVATPAAAPASVEPPTPAPVPSPAPQLAPPTDPPPLPTPRATRPPPAPTPDPSSPTAAMASARVRALPTCDKLIRCLQALSTATGPIAESLGSGAASTLDGVKTMAQLDGMGDFDADSKCGEMWAAYTTSFSSLAHLPEYVASIPSACPRP